MFTQLMARRMIWNMLLPEDLARHSRQGCAAETAWVCGQYAFGLLCSYL